MLPQGLEQTETEMFNSYPDPRSEVQKVRRSGAAAEPLMESHRTAYETSPGKK